jgi:ribonuclease HI
MLRQSTLQVSQKILSQTIPKISNANKPFLHTMYFDGCSKGNPGLAGAGAVIYTNNEETWSGSSFVGTHSTNNEAEYTGLILGLQKALDMNIKTLFVNGDSQLVIYQMIGKYRCNSSNLIPLFQTAKKLEKDFEHVEYKHVLRNLNHRADELSNIAITDYYVKKLVYK